MRKSVVDHHAIQAAAASLAGGRSARFGGVWGSAAPMLAGAVAHLTGRCVCYIVGHLDDADEAVDDLELLTGQTAELLPAWEVDLGSAHLNDEIAGERVRLCQALLDAPRAPGRGRVIVAPIMALLQPLPRPGELADGRREVRRGQSVDLDELGEWLVDAGYDRVDQVDQQGEFARRGGIVDIFAPGAREAVRLEFFGDEIDSIRRFDLDTQRSSEPIDAYAVTSAAVGLLTDPARTTTFFDYLPADAVLAIYEPAEVLDLGRELHKRASGLDTPAATGPAVLDPEEVYLRMADRAQLEMHTFFQGGGTPAGGEGFATNLGIRSLERLTTNTAESLAALEQLSRVCEVTVYCENDAEADRFNEMLAEQHPALAERVATATGHLNRGFHWPEVGWVAVGHHEVFHRYAKVRRIRRVRAGRPIESMLDLNAGDYVVHVSHGIAKYEGLRKLDRDGASEEYLTLRFSDNAKLHVPASQIQLVQKYIGMRGKRPTLSKLGGGLWARQKQRVAEAVEDLAAELLRIQAVRQASPGTSYPRRTELWETFREAFVYEETPDQVKTTAEISDDMAQSRPMDRLLCGDVGYGKTELAMRAAFKVVEAGRQVAVLVPTTVLAGQHYETFRERFADYPVTVDVVSRFRKAREVNDIVQRLSLGQLDVLIGTHRLLSPDIRFADLGLVIIDEEQRFGVGAKEKLKAMRASVDVLTMTATPIPRTLHMSMLGLRDISSLETPPMDRRAIHTEVRAYDEELIRAAIYRELSREGQVFFVHNRVMDIDAIAHRLGELVPEAKIVVGHGQMSERQLEKTMLAFVRGEADVLLSTTIIESGLDIPSANTMIIHDADRFGLAELHQLRGRVGRSQRRAYCYLLLPEARSVNPVAARRLKAIEDFSDLGAGFQIAMRDLEIRGAGNILGPQQSGHIATVGYELYCQILDRTVRQMRGEKLPPDFRAHVELGFDSYIPRTYIPSDRQRMDIYRRISEARDVAEVEQLAADLADAHGRPPEEVQTLLELAEVRVRCTAAGVRSVVLMPPDLIFSVKDFSKVEKVFENAAGSVRLPDEHTAHWRPPESYLDPPTLMRVLLKQLRQAPDRIY